MSKAKSAACPCGGANYAACCGPLLQGAAHAGWAGQLMRSRYTAFTRRDEAYLLATWHPATRPPAPLFDQEETPLWLGLEVKSDLRLRKRKEASSDVPPDLRQLAPQAQQWDTVEFVARYRQRDGRAHRLHEISRFVLEDQGDGARWYYVDGATGDSK
ncbi:YchJ family metal-binding protein [Massilia sp. W12]|uniref:YchJ family protein n=1 Tax=Massilia sp. W12 TaxID=3126507 RepID=UPI0030D348E8